MKIALAWWQHQKNWPNFADSLISVYNQQK